MLPKKLAYKGENEELLADDKPFDDLSDDEQHELQRESVRRYNVYDDLLAALLSSEHLNYCRKESCMQCHLISEHRKSAIKATIGMTKSR